MFRLHAHQEDALDELSTGKILVGNVGSGKSITALAYFAREHPDKPVVIITTAKKRDKGEWFDDALKMSYRGEIEVDSWNNIHKYVDRTGCAFIFDEQRIVGKGAWVQSFWKIAESNEWILLSATPADVWIDLMPAMVANGFYRNLTEFYTEHVVWKRFVRYPAIDKYINEHILEKYRDRMYVLMEDRRHTVRHEHVYDMDYSLEDERRIRKDRWNIFDDRPVQDVAEMIRLLRKATNIDPSRIAKCRDLVEEHSKLIIFYNLDYELEILRTLNDVVTVAEWNGHKHEAIPDTDRWVYLVQFTAGSEGWNCIETNHIAFYSLPYSYRAFEQSKGRIDRMNTPFQDLHYHILKSKSFMDRVISRSLRRKKNFQAAALGKKIWPEEKEPQKFERLN